MDDLLPNRASIISDTSFSRLYITDRLRINMRFCTKDADQL